ncbi:MAG TPA: hypothetical protein VNF99_00750, partial [Stellaceae bacterium]|nr:hypothetical protein [Stellaceae bacterium]
NIFDPVTHFNDVLSITPAVYSVPYLGQALNIATVAVAAYYCPPCAPYVAGATSALQAGVTSGKLGVALEAGAIAGAETYAFAEVGTETNFHGATLATVENNPGEYALNVLGHAAIGCAASAAGGGTCQSGAAGAGIAALATPAIATIFPNAQTNQWQFMGGLIATASVGGISSVAGGGKFENGAVTASFGYLFNEMGGSEQTRGYAETSYSGGDYVCNGPSGGCGPQGITDPTNALFDGLDIQGTVTSPSGAAAVVSCNVDGSCYIGGGIGYGESVSTDLSWAAKSWGTPVYGPVRVTSFTFGAVGAVTFEQTCSLVRVACSSSLSFAPGIGLSGSGTAGYKSPPRH